MSIRPKPLATYLHISDLHIGRLDEKSLNARTQVFRLCRVFDGLLGHSGDSLMDLEELFKDFHQQEPKVQLIVTGDLTATGHQQEFDIANQYLGGILRGPEGDRVGLEVLDWSGLAIPGNHDHWAGYPIPVGRPTPALQRYFPKLPRIQPVFPLSKGRQLRFLLTDTDADVKPISRERWKALGSFVSQLQTLTAILGRLGPNENEIRVLCLHHSLSYRGSALEIIPQSRIALEKFILDNRIAVLLCGHIHRPPWAKPFPITSAQNSPLCVLEACCGTTTQVDPTISLKGEHEGLLDTHWENSFLLHRLLEFPGEIRWETEIYLEGRAGFVRADYLRDDIRPLTTFKVWPWPAQVV